MAATPLTPKIALRGKLIEALQQEAEIPAFSEIARKLMEVVQNPKSDIDSIAEVAKLDPGITAKFLRLASSPSFSAKYITSIKDALMIIGLNEAQRLAMTIIVMGRFTVMKLRIDWELYWLHCLLTARLTEKLASSYRDVDGREYLSGLLHDLGKLYIGHHFPKEFEKSVIRAMVMGNGLFESEKELFDITHAEVAAVLCQKWKLHPDLIHAVRCHHEPDALVEPTDPKANDKQFLALCLFLADRMANITRANIQGAENLQGVQFEDLPEWTWLQRYKSEKPPAIDLSAELKKAKDIISAVKESQLVK
jgi:putative nucleotidyltransferase with HDIG domain